MDTLNFFSQILIVFLTLFAPGFFISLLLFSLEKIDTIERLALSFVLSISVIPLLTFLFNALGFSVTSQLVIVEVLAISIIRSSIYLIKNHETK